MMSIRMLFLKRVLTSYIQKAKGCTTVVYTLYQK